MIADAQEQPTLIKGGLAIDDRGTVGFVNDLDLAPVRRFYTVTNHRSGSVRAWHGHRRERKFLTVVQGAALACCVRVDDWDDPSPELAVSRFVLSGATPAVLSIPAGFANGFMTLTEGAVLMFFSDAPLEQSLADDVRFPARYWDPWQIEER